MGRGFDSRDTPFDKIIEAMTYQHLGQAEQARKTLEEVERWMAAADKEPGVIPFADRPAWNGWHDRVLAKRLHQEAVRLIRPRQSSSSARR